MEIKVIFNEQENWQWWDVCPLCGGTWRCDNTPLDKENNVLSSLLEDSDIENMLESSFNYSD